jgi:hypothetical protein
VRLRDEQRLTCSPDVLSRVLDGEAVLLDLESGEYFGLNDVGTRFWELVSTGSTYGDAREVLLAEFDVDRQTIEADLDQLITSLMHRKLVKIATDG